MPGRKAGVSNKGKTVSRSVKAGVNFPVGRIQRFIKQGMYSRRVGASAACYMAAVLEYVVAEIIEVSSDVADEHKKMALTPRHLQLAIRNDDEIRVA